MPRRNENLKRILEFCDENDIDIGDIQAAQEELRGHEMDDRLKVWAVGIGIVATLMTGAWRLFSTESIAQQAHIENQAQEARIQSVEAAVNEQRIQIAVQTTQYSNVVSQLSTIQTQQNEIIKLLNERYPAKK